MGKTNRLRSIFLVLSIFFAAFHAVSAVSCSDAMIDMSAANINPNYCVFTYKSDLGSARGMDLAPNGDLLVLDRNSPSIFALWEDDAGVVQSATLYTGLALNHALRYHDGYIYASSDQNVYRWPYAEANYRKNLGQAQVILQGMPVKGNHETRTLEFDTSNRVYVNIGSADNIDADSSRARVIRFTLDGSYPKNYGTNTQVFADGTRNEVGLRFDGRGRLWGVENGLDNLGVETRTEFGDIHSTNPSEEVNIFLESNAGDFYGYPYCWTEGPGTNGSLSFAQGLGVGTQWATKSTDATHTDTWCRNLDNNIPPVYNLPAHIAPLDITFYNGDRIPDKKGKMAIIPSHGSWNRSPAKGRMIGFLSLDNDGNPVDYEQIFWAKEPSSFFIRPVAVVVGPCKAYGECIFFSDDNRGVVFALAYVGPEGQIPQAPTSVPVAPPVAPVAIGQPVSLEVGPSTLTYTLNADDTVTISVRQQTKGWIAVGFNYNGAMITSECVLAFNNGTDVFGKFFLRNTTEQLATWNDDSLISWSPADTSLEVDGNYAIFNFTRPLASDRYPILTNGSSTYVLLAWNGNSVPSLAANDLPKHTGRGAYPINFKYGIIGNGPQNPPFTESEPNDQPSVNNQQPSSTSSYVVLSLWAVVGVAFAWIL
eukprot:TRINITY_DN1085_c0_g1_i1.p1 TRINITY_DN1085_c0_g1~~TRINITY_DN1085_c0_g1_i1.p1  ORF type:complete len:659 (+),score=143.60 TRINITY_DN1085_c0_g1_i1:28-1977(+)